MAGTKMRRRRENFELFGGILRGFWSFGGAIFDLSGSGPPAVPSCFRGSGARRGGTAEVISPDSVLQKIAPSSEMRFPYFFSKKSFRHRSVGQAIFVVFWTPRSLDPDRFRPGQAIFCYNHSHGRGTCRSPILALSTAIERRARGLSFPLLKILIGSWQLPQRAA